MTDRTHLIVSDTWLAACGYSSLSGVALEIVSTRSFGERGTFYAVRRPDGHTWEVWDCRGVELVGAPEPAPAAPVIYGDKRDYRKIDIYLKRQGRLADYVGSTTWAKNLREAREQFALANGHAASDLLANYSERRRK